MQSWREPPGVGHGSDSVLQTWSPGRAAVTEDALDCGQEILPPRAASAPHSQGPSAHLTWGGGRMSSGPRQLGPV